MSDWARVNRRDRCPICGHNSWCTVNQKIGLILCMRVESAKPSHGENGGWLHRIDPEKHHVEHIKPEPEPPQIDARAMMLDFWNQTTNSIRQNIAARLGVSVFSLYSIGAAWAGRYNAVAFPMFNGARECVGIRLRSDSGRKWAVTGSRQGIFFPKIEHNGTAYIVEGPTDTAAAITLNLFPIGRPSCNGCISYTQVAINRLGIRRAVLVADNDAPGVNGAKSLADELQVPCCHLILPVKDLREFVLFGGTRELLDSLTSQLVWHQPKCKQNERE